MISLPTNVLDLLDAGRISIRGMIRFEFGTGTYGFVMSDAPMTYNGLTYLPGGLLKFSDIVDAPGMTAQPFTITLAASSDDGLTPEVLQTIEAEDYRDRPVKLYDAYLHPDTGELLYTQAMMRGYVDTIDHFEGSEGYTIVANCETRALDYTRKTGRKRTVADQQKRNPTDGFYVHASTRGREQVYWGRANPNNPSPIRWGGGAGIAIAGALK